VNNYVNVAALLLGYAVEFDVIEELPLKKKVRRQKANEPCLELSVDERTRFLAAFADREAFSRYLADKMPKAKPAIARDARRWGARRAYGAGMRCDSDAARDYFTRFQRSRDVFLVALETGIRSGDLRHMLRRHVDFAEGWIRFVQQKTAREVVIPISRDCRLALERALADRVAGPDDLVFVTDNGVPYSVSTMQRHFKVAKRIAGINRRLRVHDLRHSFGCGLATAGLPLRFIGKVMGHTNSATTERYARPDQIVLERVREALNRER
jgi:integrase